jgi:hypothetical protein
MFFSEWLLAIGYWLLAVILMLQAASLKLLILTSNLTI